MSFRPRRSWRYGDACPHDALCHSPSTGAMKAALGVAATTCSYRDWSGTGLLVFFGANPANDQPVAMKYLDQAKRLGTKVVMVNPYREPGMDRYWVPSITRSALFGTDVTDHWFQVRTGGDIAFLSGVVKVMIENGWFDARFATEHATGFGELAAHVRTLAWPALEAGAGLPRAGMEELAALLRDAETAVFVWSMGITQHARGGDAVRMILDLGLLKGFVGRDRCGLMPIRGHSCRPSADQIWKTARDLGYGEKFIDTYKHTMLDDQTPFLEPGIPAVDIIDFDYPYWHTIQDTPDKVSADSLKAVGDILLAWVIQQSGQP